MRDHALKWPEIPDWNNAEITADGLRVRFLEEEAVREADPELRSFDNANTREALARLDSRLAPEARPGGCG